MYCAILMYKWFLLIWFHLHLTNGRANIDMHPSHIIVASKTIRPGTIYQIVVNILHMEKPIHVRASISRERVQIVQAKRLMKKGESNKLLLKIPQTTIPGDYQLNVYGSMTGGTGGNLFQSSKELSFSPKFLTILIQSNRAVYNADQTIRFRTVIMTTEMKPYADPIDINILNPKGYVMKNYGSVYLNVGVGSFTYQLPLDPNRGWWTIQVVAQTQVEEKRIYVEKYYMQRTEVYIQTPDTVMDTDEAITGTMFGWYLNNAPVLGNATIRVYVTPPQQFYKQAESLHALQDYVEQFNGNYELNIKLADLENLVSPLAGSVVTIEGSLTDQRLELFCVGYSKTRIIDGNVRMKFLGSHPLFFKSGMPFKTYLVISYADEAPLSESKLQDSTLHISRLVTHANGGSTRLVEIHDKFPNDGLYTLQFVVPENTIRMSIKAVYKDNEEMTTADLLLFPYYSLDTRSLFVYTSTKNALVGEYLIIHVRSNFYMKHFFYLVVSKGIIIHSGVETVDALRMPIKTIAIPVSSEMPPTCNVVVYHVTRDGVVISDSMRVPINPINKAKFTFELNNRKDKTGNTLEYCILTEPGDQIAVSAHDFDTSCVNCGQEITKASVLESLHSFDADHWRTSKILRASRDHKSDQLFFYDSSGFGGNDEDTFTQTGLEIITDAIIASSSMLCGNDSSYISCQDGSCFLATKVCDGEIDCRNGFDESNCSSPISEDFNIYEFRISRFSHFDQFYDMADGDWAWFDYNSNGFDAFNQRVPNRGSKWIIYAFHSNKDTGFSILQDSLLYDGTKQFCISVEMPTLCRRGEQIGIRVELFNFGETELFVTVVLMASDSYQFVHVEEKGQVRSYDARTSSGEHQHLVWVLIYGHTIHQIN
uniref:Alpha-2-macroglobulin bait region domain-containing protein n=1 Tax=Strigamia maritima TaxID=126957 RepID=T1J445_STRMM